MHPRELPVPMSVSSDPKAIELLRVWAAHGKQHVSLATSLWNDPAAWGIILVDLAKHVASAYQQLTGKEYASSLSRIREGFDAEWEIATDEPSGTVLE